MSSSSKSESGQLDTLPSPVKTVRILMWVQTAAAILICALQVWNLTNLRKLSDAQLSEWSGGQITSQSEVPYGQVWTLIVVLLICGLAVGFCASRLRTRSKTIKTFSLVSQMMLAVLILLTLPVALNLVLIVLPAIVIIVMLLREPARSWFHLERGSGS